MERIWNFLKQTNKQKNLEMELLCVSLMGINPKELNLLKRYLHSQIYCSTLHGLPRYVVNQCVYEKMNEEIEIYIFIYYIFIYYIFTYIIDILIYIKIYAEYYLVAKQVKLTQC